MKCWRFLRWGVLILNLSGAALVAGLHTYHQHQWQTCQERAAAQGIRLDLPAYQPPPVADNENFAATPSLAAWTDLTYDPVAKTVRWTRSRPTETNLPWPTPPPGPNPPNYPSLTSSNQVDLAAWVNYLPLFPDHPPCTNQDDAAREILAAFPADHPLRQELVAALKRPGTRFNRPDVYAPSKEQTLFYVGAAKRIAQLFCLRACAGFRTGHPDEALTDLLIALRLADGCRNDPTILSQFVANDILSTVLASIREGVNRHALPEAGVIELQRTLTDYHPRPGAVAAAKNDFIMIADTIDQMLNDTRWAERSKMTKLLPMMEPPPLLKTCVFVSPLVNFSSAVKAATFRQYEMVYGATSTNFPKWFPDLYSDGNSADFLGGTLSDMAGRMMKVTFRLENHLELARAALALERHYLAQGHYPSSLDAAFPYVLGPPPLDVFTGKPLNYRLADGTYRLWTTVGDPSDDPRNFSPWQSSLPEPPPPRRPPVRRQYPSRPEPAGGVSGP